ncbi:MAG TPA: glycosyl transferase [Armatimonadetes bacterium]|nr:glycosyl transferase [Armatimonadota bacterium]
MKCSLLIPSYRRGPALRDCLDGVVANTRLPDEVVIVLRDTDEESHAIVQEWLAHSDHAGLFRVVDVTPRGQIAAINRGLEAVTGDIVVLTDDDAVPRADWLERLLSHYADPEVGGVGGRDVVHHGETVYQCTAHCAGRLTWYGKLIGNHHCDYPAGVTQVDHLKGVNMSFRRELVKPFETRIWGPHFNDTDQSLSVAGQGYRLIYDPGAIVDHYPADRPDSSAGRNMADPRQVYLDAHDHCYLLMKHLPARRRLIWLPYLLLVGSKRCPGLLIFILEALTFRAEAPGRFGAVIAGTIAALTRRQKPEGL